MFASKTPRDLPVMDDGAWRERGDEPWGVTAPPTLHVQHNEPNPILVEFREEWESTAFSELLHWWLPTLEENTYPGWTEPQIEHARRVLTRLIAVSD